MAWLYSAQASAAADSVCALVKIQIDQVLTLERQAFDARMAITNHLDTIPLRDIAVNVHFTDEQGDSVQASSDPDTPSASFYIRVDTLSGIDDVGGSGTLGPKATAEIHWLIIPSPGAGGDVVTGKRYDVGATLTYTRNGDPEEIAVAPDLIFVKPQPRLKLDYFLTEVVVADDAFTDAIEPAEPFTLGVRVINSGLGPANSLSIDTAQPEIVENAQGLRIDFRIIASEIDDQATTPSLQLDFGDIEAGETRMGRWWMETTLSGRFIDFSAEFSHADDLGGALTSLLDAVNTHILVHDVRVDLFGRDNLRDFLAKDGDLHRVYESEGTDSEVLDRSEPSALTQTGAERYELTMPATPGFAYVRVADPYAGTKFLLTAYRSDGRALPKENTWQSKRREGNGPWFHYLNLFDAATAPAYTLVFGNALPGNRAPVLQFISDRSLEIGTWLSFFVEAGDPDGTLPMIIAQTLPQGASFDWENSANALVRHVFDWTPVAGQNGPHRLTFVATDGALSTSRDLILRVTSPQDTDGDGMDDAWEMAHFGTLDRDGTGDLDGDGIPDLDEFKNGTDPSLVGFPHPPRIETPQNGARVTTLQPLLSVRNGAHDSGSEVIYQFELYAQDDLGDSVAVFDIAEQPDITAWPLNEPLADNSWFDWRVRACDQVHCSEWVYAHFVVNTANDPPGPFHISYPQFGVDVNLLQPLLTVTNSLDPDGDPVSYRFEVYRDSLLGEQVTSASGLQGGDAGTTAWGVDIPLAENTAYVWQVFATDPRGATTEAMETGGFFVNTVNAPPAEPAIIQPKPGARVALTPLRLTVANAADPEGQPVSYRFELDTLETFDSPEKQRSPVIDAGATGTTVWQVEGLLENSDYHWRVMASDGQARSDWVRGTFFLNVHNEPPPTPQVRNPSWSSWVDTRRPTLSITPVQDPDGDPLSYRFEIAASGGFEVLAGTADTPEPQWTVNSDLFDNTWYYWRVKAWDSQGLESSWATGYLFVNENGLDDPPSLTLTQPGSDVTLAEGTVRIAWEDADPDSNAVIDLYYETGVLGSGGIPIIQGLPEDPDSDRDDAFLWDIGALPHDDYHVFGRISDARNEEISYAPGRITIGAQYTGSVSVTLLGDAQTVENGVGTTFSIVLNSRPEKTVTIPVTSGDLTEGRVKLRKQRLKFKPRNWDRPQTVTVTGADDCLADGDIAYDILIGPVISKDPAYSGVDPDDLRLTNLDDEPPVIPEILSICDLILVGEVLAGEHKIRHHYRAEIVNNGPAISGATATVSSTLRRVKVRQRRVKFGPVAAGGSALSIDTFSVTYPEDFPFDSSLLKWSRIRSSSR